MKKLFLLLCSMLLLCTQVFAYEVLYTVQDPDMGLVYVLLTDDGLLSLTEDQYYAFVLEQESTPADDVQESTAADDVQEGQVITASGDVIDYADYDAYYAADPSALVQESASESVAVRSYSSTDSDYPEGSMKYVVSSIFGSYVPVTESVTTYLADGSTVTTEQVVMGISGVDWMFLCGVLLFSIVLYAFLRLLGVILHV